jgi:PhoH-like ATPase
MNADSTAGNRTLDKIPRKKGDVMNSKIYVLDTNVLVHDPESILKFEDNNLVIPVVVLEELDSLKKGNDEVARNAREATRQLDALRSRGKLSEGVALDGGGMLRVELNHQDKNLLPVDLPLKSADNRILCVARYLQVQEALKEENAIMRRKPKVILVTKDTNLRVKADALGIEAQDYRNDKVEINSLYNGFTKDGSIPNSFFESNGELLRQCGDRGSMRVGSKAKVLSLKTRNKEQACAVDILTDSNIPLIALVGPAGTGKTLLAIAAGVEKVRNGEYKRLVVTRPTIPVGNDLGFLPGSLEEKLYPWMKAIWDVFGLIGVKAEGKKGDRKGKLAIPVEVAPLMYMRGISMHDTYFVVDEAQNLTPHETKTIVTRAGEGTKIVFTGDPWQIDHPYLDSGSNGLSYLVSRFKGDSDFATVTLSKGERSRLAEKAAKLL